MKKNSNSERHLPPDVSFDIACI